GGPGGSACFEKLALGGRAGKAGSSGLNLVVTLTELESAQATRKVTLKAPRRGCHLVTDEVAGAVDTVSSCSAGLLNLAIRHTSASLTVNENADPTVRTDMEAALNRIVPEKWNQEFFEHTMEGPDDMPAHVKSTLIGASVTVPVCEGRIALGTWQGVYLCEHRDVGGWGSGHEREVIVTLRPSRSAPS
ncbi:hypothetical protein CYMTET_35852, partial [Cymbomonas tetramitiformis]